MPSVCFYFQVHQPYRIKRYSFFDIGHDHFYEDDEKNRLILNKVSDKCYLPANQTMLELIKKHKGKFKISYSLSGTLIEQLETYRPDVLKSFIDLSKTGCVEFLSETYYHSLAFIYSKDEFIRQVKMHDEKILKYFGQKPKVFRNTELIYNNTIASYVEEMGFKGILCEGVDKILSGRTPNYVYKPKGCTKIKALLKNYSLSDDIAFRFSDVNWNEFPLTADKFAGWVHKIAGNGEVLNLFMDYETFGEHQWASTGIFDFLSHLPAEIMKHKDFNFLTPSEVIDKYPARDEYDVKDYTSWADAERDLSAWLSNSMEQEAAKRLYALEKKVMESGDKDIIQTWGKLQTSDHFYYMCTKFWSDGDVHKYFSPYDSPYDAYIYFMNVYSDFEATLDNLSSSKPAKTTVKKVAVKIEKADTKPKVVKAKK
jgi:alpha-amylase